MYRAGICFEFCSKIELYLQHHEANKLLTDYIITMIKNYSCINEGYKLCLKRYIIMYIYRYDFFIIYVKGHSLIT